MYLKQGFKCVQSNTGLLAASYIKTCKAAWQSSVFYILLYPIFVSSHLL